MQLYMAEGLQAREPEMITSDTSEMRALDFTEISGVPVVPSDSLEELTGADLMISPLSIPFAPMTLAEHISKGAVFIQIKRGNDMVASIGDRAASSLARMIDCGTKAAWQRLLLFVGALNFDEETGAAVINGRPNLTMGPRTYWMVQGTIEKWIERGGTFTTIPRMSMLEDWLIVKMGHIREFGKEPVRRVYKAVPQLTDVGLDLVQGVPLQKLVIIKDWRNTIITFPGIGEKRADAIYSYICSRSDKTLLSAIIHLTSENLVKDIPGISSGQVAKCREWLGIEDIFDLSLTIKEE